MTLGKIDYKSHDRSLPFSPILSKCFVVKAFELKGLFLLRTYNSLLDIEMINSVTNPNLQVHVVRGGCESAYLRAEQQTLPSWMLLHNQIYRCFLLLQEDSRSGAPR